MLILLSFIYNIFTKTLEGENNLTISIEKYNELLLIKKEDNIIKKEEDSNDNIEIILQNKIQELLYFESIMNIEPFLFLIEINSLSNYGVIKIIESMIFPIQISLENLLSENEEITNSFNKKKLIDLINNLSNFSKSVSILNEPKLSKSLEIRNMFFLNDKSQIAKQLYLDNLKIIKDSIKEIPEDKIINLLKIDNLAVKRLKYKKMFEEFVKAILQTENIQKVLKNERENFLNLFLFSDQMDLTEYKKIRMIINLGGSFILPSLMFSLNEKLLHPEKEEFLHKTLLKIIKPVETLKLSIRHRSNSEKKFLILKFLNECLKNSNIFSEAFESRSSLLQIYFKNDIEKIHKIDFYQDLMLKKYIKYLETIDSDYFDRFLVSNRETINTYYQYLNTGQVTEKERLEEFFEHL